MAVASEWGATWAYTCEDNHRWSVREPTDGVEPGPSTCPFGHEAVTASRQPWADRVAFVLSPAARVADDVTQAVVDDQTFFVEITDRSGVPLATSSRSETLHRATAYVAELAGVPTDVALGRASRMGFRLL